MSVITAAERTVTRARIEARERPGIAATTVKQVARWSAAEWFIVLQTALPALLFLPGTQAIRLPLRIAPFAISLALLAHWVFAGGLSERLHPARRWLTAIVILLALMLGHPFTNTAMSAIAQVFLYISVLGPAFWLPRTIRDTEHARRLLVLMLLCNGSNAVVGVLQAYDPARFMPAELSARVLNSTYGLSTVSYVGPDGTVVVRPPGLFDNPGAVAVPATYAALLGVVFATTPGPLPIRMLFGAFAVAGVAAICLSLVRTNLLVLGGMFAFYVWLLVRRNEFGRLALVVPLVIVVAVGGFRLGVHLGGDAVAERFGTLTDEGTAAYRNAGRTEQLQYAMTDLLMQFPLGAGPGRWGMMQDYFGDPLSATAPPIWAELQPNGWILDGGIFLVILYGLALFVTTREDIRLIKNANDRRFRLVAGVITAANAGVLAMIFGFTPFTNQMGTQYWVLTAILHGAALRQRAR